MPLASVKMLIWHLMCHDCQYKGIVYVIAGDGYGRFIGRTSMKELAFLDAMKDEVFDEVRRIVVEDLGLNNSYYVRRALSVVYDPAPSGQLYDFTGNFKCPACGSRDIRYGPGVTPEAEMVEVYLATHDSWLRLSDEEKKERISNFLQRDESCPTVTGEP